jgi:multicomponent Na+:H+ antiporter subunit F
MITLFAGVGALIILVIASFLGRVIVGPTIFDRVVALNGIGVLFPLLMIMAGMVYGRIDMFVDLALAIYLLNLFTTLLIARYVRHKAEETDR